MKQLLLFLICNLAFLLTVQGNSAEIPPAVMFKQLSTTEGLSNNSKHSANPVFPPLKVLLSFA